MDTLPSNATTGQSTNNQTPSLLPEESITNTYTSRNEPPGSDHINVIHNSAPETKTVDPGSASILSVALHLASHLHTEDVIEQLVSYSFRLTQARFVALGIVDSHGQTKPYVFSGMPEPHPKLPLESPNISLFEFVPADSPLRLQDIREHADIEKYRNELLELGSFMGVPIWVRNQLYARLYLTGKPGGFTEQDLNTVVALAQATAVAVENSILYRQARQREEWIAASRDITQALLEGSDEEEALEMIAQRLRQASNADTAILILPSLGEDWTAEIVDGDFNDSLLGLVFPPDGRAMTVIRTRIGLLVDEIASQRILRLEPLRRFGPALYAPLVAKQKSLGVALLLRHMGREEFTQNDLEMAQLVAAQAALALQIAETRHHADVLTLSDERARIGRDIHDFAVQQLFATGMQIDRLKEELQQKNTDEQTIALFEKAVTAVDESVRQIRGIIRQLNEGTDALVLVERLRQEASTGRAILNFAPSILIRVDGELVDESNQSALGAELDDRLGTNLCADVAAVVRECLANTARHAHAKSVKIVIDVQGRAPEGLVRVKVVDDGVGPDSSVTRRSGIGNLAARARQYKGSFCLSRGEDQVGAVAIWQAHLL